MEASSYDGVLKFATKTVLYQPRRAVISTFLANLMLADFADDSIVIANFGLSTFLAKPRWLKSHHAVSSARSDGKNSHQLSWRIWACPNCMIVDDSRWQCMVIRVQRRVIVKTIIVYREVPFERGFSYTNCSFTEITWSLLNFSIKLLPTPISFFGTRGATADLLLLLLVF